MAKVYVSSTVADLERERRAVTDWLVAARHQPVHSYLPSSETVRDSCLDDVDTCDLYVLILGHRYGFVPEDGNPEGLSITHLEFRRAGQAGIPRIALLRTGHPDASVSKRRGSQQAALVAAFRAEVTRAVRAGEFGDLQGLVQGLSTGVQAALSVAGEPRLEGLVDVLVDGRLPRVATLDPYSLGATPSAYGNAGTYGRDDKYVFRTKDDLIATALSLGRLVVVVGPSKAGKTRTAFEVLRRHTDWHNALLAAPVPQTLTELASHSALRGHDRLVIWLDDLQRFLPPIAGLSTATISRLLGRPGPTVLLGTLRAEQRDLLRGVEGEFTREVRTVLDSATSIDLSSTREDPDEQTQAAAAYPQLSSRQEGLAEALAGAPELLRKYHDAATADPLTHSLVQTCVDWARCGLTRPIQEPDLLAFALNDLAKNRPDLDPSDQEWHNALRRARQSIAGGGQVALLQTEKLAAQTRGYQAFDYLVAADDGQGGQRIRPLSEATWDSFLDRATDDDAFSIGVAAANRDNRPIALAAARRAAEAGHKRAQGLLAMLLWAEEGNPQPRGEARIWLTRAAEGGDPSIQAFLATLLWRDPGDRAEARLWLTRAAEAGDPDSQHTLGELLAFRTDPPELAEGRTWLTRAAEAGHTGAQYDLGRLLAFRIDPPELAESRTWLTRAAEAGLAGAQYALGLLLATKLDPPELSQARIWLARAAEAGHTDAQNHLGLLLAELLDPPELAEARTWYKQAAEAGNTDAQDRLGLLLAFRMDPPELAEGRIWLTRAAEAGHTDAQNHLGLLLFDESRGSQDLAGARTWWTQAAEAGHTDAQFYLGALLAELLDPPELAEARTWYTRAAEAGHTGAQDSLGRLLAFRMDPPELAEGRVWLTRAAEAGDTSAQLSLGQLLVAKLDPPDMVGARIWFTRAAEAGHTRAQHVLGLLLASQLDPPELREARTWLTRAAEAGDTRAQHSLGLLLATKLDPPELREARTWLTRAAEAGDATALNTLTGLNTLSGRDRFQQNKWLVLLSAKLDSRGLAEARSWLTRATEAGHVSARDALTRASKWRSDRFGRGASFRRRRL